MSDEMTSAELLLYITEQPQDGARIWVHEEGCQSVEDDHDDVCDECGARPVLISKFIKEHAA